MRVKQSLTCGADRKVTAIKHDGIWINGSFIISKIGNKSEDLDM